MSGRTLATGHTTKEEAELKLIMNAPTQLALPAPPRRVTLDLLEVEDWPRSRSSSSSIDAKHDDEMIDIDGAKPESNHRVSFSEISMQRCAERDDYYSYTKSYSEADYDHFQRSMLLDARRLKLITTIRIPPQFKKEYVKFLFENNVIAPEDFVGIERLVLGKGGLVLRARKLHREKVLQQQHEQRRYQQDNPTEILAKVAEESSLKSTYSARIRAQ